MRFRPEQHLRLQLDFRRVRTEGRRCDCGAFTLWQVARPERASGVARVGVVASRVAVGGAIDRNRAKRRLREIFRLHQSLVPPGQDLLLVARAAAIRLPAAVLGQKFAAACRQLFSPATPP